MLLCETAQGFWLVGVLLGWALAFRAGLGIRGLWIGIASGDSTAGAHCTVGVSAGRNWLPYLRSHPSLYGSLLLMPCRLARNYKAARLQTLKLACPLSNLSDSAQHYARICELGQGGAAGHGEAGGHAGASGGGQGR